MAKQPKRLSKKAPGKKDEELIKRVRDRYKIMTEADDDNRVLAMDDLRFVNVPGEQWDENMIDQRGERPCYEFNKLRVNGKRVINEIRANRPQGKVRGVEGGDTETAEIYEGLIRNIWNVSDGDTVIDHAAEYMVDAGMGAWRIDTEYSSDTQFDQDIVVSPIKNPFCLYADPSSQDQLKRDAEDWILTERISKDSFERKYPDAEAVNFDDTEFDDDDEWEDDEQVRIAEYWYKERETKDLWVVTVPDPQGSEGGFKQIVVDSESDEGQAMAARPGFKPDRTRAVSYWKIYSAIVSGDAVLEQPAEWAGSMFPFVMIYGEYKVIDGKPHWWGLHRFSKDAQQSYNVSRTATDEAIAASTRGKFWATAQQAEGLTDQWSKAHKENLPFQLYNYDPEAPGAPPQIPPTDVPVALIQQSTLAAQDIRDTAGLHEASFGEESNEKSGIALQRKQAQASLVTYNFPDNMAKGIRRTWELLIDLIPEIYDAERELRIIGSDGSEDYKRVNQVVQDPQTGQTLRINDLSAGKYDVTVTVGPSFSTLRQEAAETYGQLAQSDPLLMPTAGDLVYESLDLPYAQDIAKRRRAMLPPEIQRLLSEDKEVPPEAQAVMAQAEAAMAQVQQQTQLVQAAAEEVAQEKLVAEAEKLKVKEAVAELEVKRAQFDADVAKKMADLTKQMAALAIDKAQVEGVAAQTEFDLTATQSAGAAIEQIRQMAAAFMADAAAAMTEIEAKSCLNIVMPQKAKMTSLVVKREKGKMVGEPTYDGPSDEPRVIRIESTRAPDGSIVGVPIYSDPESAPQANIIAERVTSPVPELEKVKPKPVSRESTDVIGTISDAADRIAAAAAVMAAPKVLVRDSEGRPVGVRPGDPGG